nr:hypothetical protein [uncultured bacterium]
MIPMRLSSPKISSINMPSRYSSRWSIQIAHTPPGFNISRNIQMRGVINLSHLLCLDPSSLGTRSPKSGSLGSLSHLSL